MERVDVKHQNTVVGQVSPEAREAEIELVSVSHVVEDVPKARNELEPTQTWQLTYVGAGDIRSSSGAVAGSSEHLFGEIAGGDGPPAVQEWLKALSGAAGNIKSNPTVKTSLFRRRQ